MNGRLRDRALVVLLWAPLAGLVAGCGEAPDTGLPGPAPHIPTLIQEPLTCETAFEAVQSGGYDAEFDTLIACGSRDQWIEVGLDALPEDRTQLEEYLQTLCGSGPRYAETPVCRDPSATTGVRGQTVPDGRAVGHRA